MRTHIFLSPHPDDIIISLGGYISDLYKNNPKDKIIIIFITSGDISGKNRINNVKQALSKNMNLKKILFVDLKVLELEVYAKLRICYNKIALVIKKYSSDCYIYSPPKETTHPDHLATFFLAKTLGLIFAAQNLYYEDAYISLIDLKKKYSRLIYYNNREFGNIKKDLLINIKQQIRQDPIILFNSRIDLFKKTFNNDILEVLFFDFEPIVEYNLK